MQIVITQDEIIDAIKDYIGNQGISTRNRDISVELKMTRNPTAYTAAIDITRADVSAKAPENQGNTMQEHFSLKSSAQADPAKEDPDQAQAPAVETEEEQGSEGSGEDDVDALFG